MEKVLIDVLGWIGTISFLVAYALVSTKKVDGDSWAYQGLNILAGTLPIIEYTLPTSLSFGRAEHYLGVHRNLFTGAQAAFGVKSQACCREGIF